MWALPISLGVGKFFVFKQKTAYELRISDWSSDVCSSDLHGRDSNQWSECLEVAQSLQDAALAQGVPPLEARAWLDKAFRDLGYGEDEAGQLAEIGRASWRESVCQEV